VAVAVAAGGGSGGGGGGGSPAAQGGPRRGQPGGAGCVRAAPKSACERHVSRRGAGALQWTVWGVADGCRGTSRTRSHCQSERRWSPGREKVWPSTRALILSSLGVQRHPVTLLIGFAQPPATWWSPVILRRHVATRPPPLRCIRFFTAIGRPRMPDSDIRTSFTHSEQDSLERTRGAEAGRFT